MQLTPPPAVPSQVVSQPIVPIQMRPIPPTAPTIAPRPVEAGENGQRGAGTHGTNKGSHAARADSAGAAPRRGQHIDVTI
jgi:hypothetical protein